MLARTPTRLLQRQAASLWQRFCNAERKRPAQQPKLPRERYRHLIDLTARILRRGEPTHFAFEADCRHRLRVGLIMMGWGWHLADLVAADIVAAALRQIGAKRPTWAHGQPRYTEEAGSLIERIRCVRCGRKLPEGHRLWCSRTCIDATRNERGYRDAGALDRAVAEERRERDEA